MAGVLAALVGVMEQIEVLDEQESAGAGLKTCPCQILLVMVYFSVIR
ncbi:MAG: hypothetical protein IT324_01560 [Anaerolineae bacterium]|nr:hypothetical protein [Anaerolineae bacterium]